METKVVVILFSSYTTGKRNLFANCQENMVICFCCHLCCLNAIFHTLNGTVMTLISTTSQLTSQPLGFTLTRFSGRLERASHMWFVNSLIYLMLLSSRVVHLQICNIPEAATDRHSNATEKRELRPGSEVSDEWMTFDAASVNPLTIWGEL